MIKVKFLLDTNMKYKKSEKSRYEWYSTDIMKHETFEFSDLLRVSNGIALFVCLDDELGEVPLNSFAVVEYKN